MVGSSWKIDDEDLLKLYGHQRSMEVYGMATVRWIDMRGAHPESLVEYIFE